MDELENQLTVDLQNQIVRLLIGKNLDVSMNALALCVATAMTEFPKERRTLMLMQFTKQIAGYIPVIEQARAQPKPKVN